MRKKFKRFWRKIYESVLRNPTPAQQLYALLIWGRLKWRTF